MSPYLFAFVAGKVRRSRALIAADSACPASSSVKPRRTHEAERTMSTIVKPVRKISLPWLANLGAWLVNGREATALCCTDRAKVERNMPAIISLHAASILFMENFTNIEYPFQ